MDKDLVCLSRLISYALRHEPWVFELELDAEGWVDIDKLISSLKIYQPQMKNIDKSHFQMIIDQSEKKRLEMNQSKIRALYGHSIPMRLLKEPAKPPDVLYHGTTLEIAELIKNEGLKPMARQYVHLSVETATAKEVAKRKGKHIMILKIDAKRAYHDKIAFYFGNDKVWLSDAIPATYINFNN